MALLSILYLLQLERLVVSQMRQVVALSSGSPPPPPPCKNTTEAPQFIFAWGRGVWELSKAR